MKIPSTYERCKAEYAADRRDALLKAGVPSEKAYQIYPEVKK